MTQKQLLAVVNRLEKHLHKTTEGYVGHADGVHWRNATRELDRLKAGLQPKPKRKVPALGPVVRGGTPILEQDLTHATGGLDGYPAFDDAVGHPGMAVIAPEALTVTRQSSARRRDGQPNGKAFYATGASGLQYWFGHVDVAPAVGAAFRKGQRMAAISANHEAPHVHVGINAHAVLGHELAHHTNYTHGAPKVGAQLRKELQ